MNSSDTLLLGRITYQAFAAAWPHMEDQPGYDEMMNIQKVVVSKTLEMADWKNSKIIKDNVAEEIKKLKQQNGKDILVFGSGILAHFLKENGLVDEYHLLVYPVVLGSGKRLFKDADDKNELKLVGTKTFSSGVVALNYKI